MAENTKENLLKTPYIYYISNPKVPELYCLPVPMYVDLSEHIKNYELPNWHTKAPSKDLKNPVWSLDVADWVEADENSQGAILAKQAKQIDSLLKANEVLEKDNKQKNQDITELQHTIQQSSAATGKLSMQFNQFGSQVTRALQDVTKAVNDLKSEGSDK
ncbi:hypothetical protein EFS28_08000 [Lactobacillus acidophilus]|uniref:hypothetical protein n=1 Tax=Lactobacillus acidophilus TaxID=1579 RepID=UPI0021A69685|nr:hypothetical protein [Lactobacillus acidophilus]MCT3603164.1 hypothetical protein [Lactobacillus acidophilus]MCT3624147.1 hypothetical protein [Lactobacillus acidophilus]